MFAIEGINMHLRGFWTSHNRQHANCRHSTSSAFSGRMLFSPSPDIFVVRRDGKKHASRSAWG